ncbi:MAG: hypothetical protein FWC45_03455 [Treponema sp.]|nr:hypothetical protein [Treponema sp.]
MAAYNSKKTSWLRCLVSFVPAAGVAALLCALFAGPRLGPFYDLLLRRRPSPPVSRELLIIDSSVPGQDLGEDILDPGAASSLLYTMTELGAKTLIIQVPILGLSAGGKAGEAEILYRFDEEFSLLSSNIRNLFDAIRTGSIAPLEAARYVGELVDLSEKGKERLVSALVRRDEEGIGSMEKAAAFFGHVRRPGDLRVQLIMAGGSGRPGVLVERNEYSRFRPDRDGVLRRIAPVLTVPLLSGGEAGVQTLEHIIYGALKTRYESSEIMYVGSDSNPLLTLKNGPDGQDTVIPLDRDGAVLFEPPHNGEDFRRIGIADFLAYDEADRALRRLLTEGDALGIYQGIEGEKRPDFLYDYALSLREDIVASAAANTDAAQGNVDEEKIAWRDARQKYLVSLEDFLYGPTEMNLVGGYEEIIDSGSPKTAPDSSSRDSSPRDSSPLGEAGIARITEMRDSLIRTFVALREKYNEVLDLRGKLGTALSGSFCILGRGSPSPVQAMQAPGGAPSLLRDLNRALAHSINSPFHRSNPTDTETSALLANSILTGRAVKPGKDVYLLLGALVWALITCFFIKSLSPALTLGIGAFLTILIGAGFSWSFIFSGLWLDPLVPAAASGTGVLVSFAWAFIAKGRYSRLFRLAYGPFVSHSCLKSVIRAGRPLPSQTSTAWAAVVTIKRAEPAANRDSSESGAPAQGVLAFQEKVSEIFRHAGGTITGTEGDLVTACFGSPLERVFLGSKKEPSPYEGNIHARTMPALRAVDLVSEIARDSRYSSWNFGLDMGSCTFSWTALSGYTALGTPVQRARVLSRLAGRYRARIIISTTVNEALPDLAVKKLDVLKEAGAGGEEPFYQLSIRE